MTYDVPPRLAHVIAEAEANPEENADQPVVYLMRLPDGPPLRLAGTAALIWMIAAEGHADVVQRVAEAVERPPSEISGDVEDYVKFLLRDGLLTGADVSPKS